MSLECIFLCACVLCAWFVSVICACALCLCVVAIMCVCDSKCALLILVFDVCVYVVLVCG